MNPLPADLPAAVKKAVGRHTGALDVPPVPWGELERRHRRTTLRRYGLAVISVLSVVALVATFGPGRGMLTKTAPPAGSPRYLQDHSLGRLAHDRAWSAAMLRRAGHDPYVTPERLLFADDIDGTRAALVRTRFNNELMFCWYSGPAGSAASAMKEEECDGPARVNRVVLGPTTADPRHATALAVAASGALMTVWTNNDVGPDGRIKSDVATGQEVIPGVYAVQIAVPFPQVDLRLNGLSGGDWRGPAYGTILNPPRLSDAQWWAPAVPGARGDATPTPPPGLAVQRTYDALGLRSDIPGARVLWVRRGSATIHSLLALRAPSGGWVLVATDSTPPVKAAGGGTAYGSDIESVVTRPAGNLDQLAIAWWLTRPSPYGRSQPTTELGMVGPRNAVTARITVAGAPPVTIPLQHGAGVGDVPDAEHVTFLGSGGQALASTTVGEPWSWDNGTLSHQI